MLGPALSGQFAALSSIGAGGGTFTGAVTFSSTTAFTGIATFAAATYFADGDATAPGVAYSGAHGTGMYRATTTLGWAIGGTGYMALTSTGLTIPALNGTTTNDSAAAGKVGEIMTNSAATDSIGTWGTNTAQNITSLALTAGDWDVQGKIVWGGATTGTYTAAAVTTTTGSIGSDPLDVGRVIQPFLTQANSYLNMVTDTARFSLAAPATVYLVGQIGFTVGTPLAGGYIRARRVR